MTSNWAAFTTAEPDFAKTAEERFGGGGAGVSPAKHSTHHVLATLRKDGSPRTSGLEVRFRNGELWLGMMPNSLKALDLRRDPRFALQANPGSGTEMAGGDVRISGRAVEVTEPETVALYTGKTGKTEEVEQPESPESFHLFRTELTEVVRTYVEDNAYLVVQIWKPGQPVRSVKRE
ncbi:pyridoxamine 5'-phosphate oxidase family protein [Streptomyces yerevanensis]|uniref:pyridoxamine 5'-phosphate oxidase family protein n=1 Tax=Streptomyces yerevanensis TaxID=66378 RepID=UPI000527A337|nr:pyridoxamine 5'-phosphate oxidase family protein [Streptomyces yerevanensis]